MCGSYSEIHTECVKQSVECSPKKISLIITDEVEERVDTVGNLEQDESSSVGDSEEEEADSRVQQKVGGTVEP